MASSEELSFDEVKRLRESCGHVRCTECMSKFAENRGCPREETIRKLCDEWMTRRTVEWSKDGQELMLGDTWFGIIMRSELRQNVAAKLSNGKYCVFEEEEDAKRWLVKMAKDGGFFVKG